MKKVLAVLAVVALTVISSVAMAEVTVSGTIDIRNLAHNNTTDYSSDSGDSHRTTQERVRINIDGKSDNVKGRVTIEGDWAQWGTTASGQEVPQNKGNLGFREAWIDFTLPGLAPAHVKVGHQFLQLGNGWFFRSMKYGSDAWVVGLPGKNTIAFVDVKFQENNATKEDDVDAYVLLDTYKIDDASTVGAYLVDLASPTGSFFGGADKSDLYNLGVFYNGKLGPVNLQFEADMQAGKIDMATGTDPKFKGWQAVLQAKMDMGDASVNATIASGSGDQNPNGGDMKYIVTALDKDPRYTVVYEWMTKTACSDKNTGFCNTQAINLGAGYAVSKNLSLQLDAWLLTANEKVSLNGGTASDDLGTEVDLKVNWKLYDNLTWNWSLGRLMPGDAYKNAAGKADDVDVINGVLSYKF